MKKELVVPFSALFAAVICVSAFVITPFHVVLMNAACILTGVLLGGRLAALPTLLWLFAGVAGLPVFAGGQSGIATILAPWGGFYFGYIIGSAAAGLVAGTPSVAERKIRKASVLRVSLAMLCGMSLLYVPGVAWYARRAGVGAGAALAVTLVPFIIPDLIKVAACVPLALKIRPLVAQYLYQK